MTTNSFCNLINFSTSLSSSSILCRVSTYLERERERERERVCLLIDNVWVKHCKPIYLYLNNNNIKIIIPKSLDFGFLLFKGEK